MAWTAPITWTASVVTVAQMNTHIRDNELYLRGFHGARMYQAAAESQTTTGAFQLVTWDTIDFDTDSVAVLASEWFVVPSGFDGYWRLSAVISYASSATGITRTGKIMKNETYTTRVPNGVGTDLCDGGMQGSGAGILRVPMDVTAPLMAGDHVTVEANQNSGGTLAFDVGKSALFFEANYLGS